MGRILAEQIDAAVTSAVDGDKPIFTGLLSDEDLLLLETFSEDTSIITMDLAADIIVMPGSDEDAAGRYLAIVAQNINAQKRYRFLLPGRLDTDWREKVIRMRAMLNKQCPPDAVNKYCQFRTTDLPVFAGLGIFKLDATSMKMRRPSFLEVLREFIDTDSWIGATLPQSEHLPANTLHDMAYLENSKRQFDYMWKNSSPL